jgi:hypothetical protein
MCLNPAHPHGVIPPTGTQWTFVAAQAPSRQIDPKTIKALLLKRVKHPALVNLVGAKQFNQGVTDVHELLQSEVFLQQVGMKVVEALITAWFPELQEDVSSSSAT